MLKDKTRLVEIIKQEEGLVPFAYADSLGYATIGYGRLIDQRSGGISQSEAEYLLKNDIDRVIENVDARLPWLEKHPDHVKMALYNMAFQMGVAGLLQFKNTLHYVRDGLYSKAADNALLSQWAKQTPARAKRIAAQLKGEEK